MNNLFYAVNIAPLRSDAALYERALFAVSPARRERILSIKPLRERCLSLGGALLLQNALKTLEIRDPVFACGDHGKPYLPDFPEVHFNVSHAGEYALCALSDAPVGCDVERIRPLSPHLPERVLSPEELASLTAQPEGTERETLFFRFWTLKESYLKAVGCGITVELASVSFDLSGDAPLLARPPFPGQAFFREYADLPGYRCALCRTAAGEFPPLTAADLCALL